MHAKGKFTITVRDKDTLEEKRVVEANNIVTRFGEWKMHRERGMLASEHGYYDDIVISNEKMAPGVDLHEWCDHRYASGTNLASPKWYVETETTPGYVELYQRFQPSGTREINSIYIGDGASERMFAYAGLIEPCIQADTEVLDVYYRVQFFPGEIGFDDQEFSPTTGYADVLYRQNAYGGGQWDGTAYYATPHWGKVPPAEYYTAARHNWDYRSNLQSINTRSWSDYNWQVTNTWSRGTTTDIGRMYSWLAYGYNSGTTNNYRSGIHTPLLPDDFPYKPVQPIHRHTVDAPTPFLDVDYLATSTGIYNTNGDAWTRIDDGFPEFHRIDFRKTGAVGEATYTIANRTCLGFYGTYFNGSTIDVGTGNYRPFHGVFPYLNERYDAFNGHGLRDVYNFAEFDDDSFIMWDASGITILNAPTGKFENYDANSTPGLYVTNVYQVASENQIIYVACADTGLWKIENARNDQVTTVITNVHNTSGCFGVDIAINEEVFALFDGGLAHSTDYGSTWTLYNEGTSPSFTHTGITDSNWSNGRGIHIDRESATYQMIVGYYIPTDELNERMGTIWWNNVDDATYLNTWNYMLDGNEGRPKTSRIKCSRYGSFWILNDNYTRSLTPNEATWTNLGHTSDYQRSNNPTFYYDNYGTPYTWAFWRWDGSSNQPCLYRKDGMFMGQIDAWGYIDAHNGWRGLADNEKTGALFAWEYNKGNGHLLAYRPGTTNDGQMSDAYRIIPIAPYFWHVSGDYKRYGVRTDSWNGIGTAYSDMVWNRYGWDGSSWVKNYNIAAADTSGNGLDGERKNFHPGDSKFHGNAVIESPTFTTTSNITIAGDVEFDIRRPYANGIDSNTWFSAGSNGEMISQRHYVTPNGSDTTIVYGDGSYDAGRAQDGYWQRTTAVLETVFHDIDWKHEFYPAMYDYTNPELIVERRSEYLANESHRLVNTFGIETGGETILNGRHAHFNCYYSTGTDRYHDYDPITDTIKFGYTSHSSGEYYGMNATFNDIHALQTEDFRVSFTRDCSLTVREEGTKFTSFYTGSLMIWLVDGDVSYTRDQGWGHFPRPAGSVEGTYMAIAFPSQYSLQAYPPRIWTRADSYDDASTAVSYTEMAIVTPWEAGDYDGTNVIDVDWVHNGTTYDITVRSNGTVRFTGTANAGGYNVARPVQKPKVIVHWHSGENGNTCYEHLGGFRITGTDGNNLTTTGTALACKTYIDGTKVDAWTIPVSTRTFDGICYGAESPRFGFNTYYDNTYAGIATDLKVWNSVLTPAQIASNEASAGTPLIHYVNVDDSYLGETKVTHATEEPTIEGLTNSFTAGSSEPSFVRSEYFTHGLIDGILKDNAISFSGSYNWYTKKLQAYTDIEDPSDPTNTNPVIPATSGTAFTDYVTWLNYSSCYTRPGRVNGNNGNVSWSYNNAFSHDYVPAGEDGELEFKVASNNPRGIMCGFDEQADLLPYNFTSYGNINYAIHLTGAAAVYIYENGTNKVIDALTYEIGDVFKVTRVGTEIRYSKNDVVFYTSLTASTGNLWCAYNSNYVTSNTVYDCKLTTTRKPYIIYLGDSETKTGRWNDDFLLLEREAAGYSVQIDGVDQIVTLNEGNNYRMAYMSDPVVGEVVIHREAGIIKFHPDEAGKNVTVSYRCIQRK